MKTKAVVERFFRTLEEQCIHRAPGTTFSNPKQRGDYNSNEEAIYDMVRLTERIVRWIVDVYHRNQHGAFNKKKSPLRAWERAPNLHEIEYPADPQQFDILTCR